MKPTQATLTLLAAAALLATQPGASCVSDGTSDSGSTGSNAPLDNGDRVPNRAEIVKEGRGVLEYIADADGTIWVQDVREEETLVSRRIHRGEKIRVAPEEDRIYLEGDAISKSDIKRDNAHRIYLEKDRRFEEKHDRNDRNDRDQTDRDDRGNNAGRGETTKVPSGAELIGEAKGKNITAWARRDGRMYVYDTDAKKVVASLVVKSGDRFVFAPDDDRITVNGTRAVDRDFSTKTNYRVYQDR